MKVKNIAIFLLFFSLAGHADGGVPTDAQGDTIPTFVGNIPFFQMPDALAADSGEYTWDYSGAVKDANQTYSIQTSIAQLARNGDVGLGMHIFDFAFQDSDGLFFSNSTYGGESAPAQQQAEAETFDNVTSSATLQQFSVIAKLVSDSNNQWSFVSADRTPIPPLYKGWVGQPGQQYQLTGTGSTFLWRYDAKTGANTVAPYTYSFSMTVLDERGAVMEGLGSGYVGPQLVPEKEKSGYNVESEIAQPRLKVLKWSVTFNAIGAAQNHYQAQYHFSGNAGMLWNDFGPLDQSHSSVSHLHDALPKGLYNGNWIPIEFTRGKYAGASLAFSVFWDKTEKNPADQSTDDTTWSLFGWCNYFSGFVPNEIDSATSTLETLYPENPAIPADPASEKPPYNIKINQYVPDKFGMGFPWAQQLTITIRANTPLRYAMAVYADTLANNKNADDPSQDLVIVVNAISPITQNTLFSAQNAQYYEGAAVPTINGDTVGYAWIEHMVSG